MSPVQSPVFLFSLGYLFAIGVTVGIGVYCFRLRRTGVARTFGVCMGALFLWSLGALGRLFAPTLVVWNASTAVMYAGIASVSVVLFVFASLYTGWITVTSNRIVMLSVVPVMSVVLLVTNAEHGLFFTAVEPVSFGGREVFTATSGAWFWIHTLYSYALFTVAIALLIGFAVRNHRVYRRQALSVVAAVALVGGVNLSYVVFFDTGLPVDPTPIAFALGSISITYGLFIAKLADVTPVARSAVFDAIDDAVFVLDTESRVVDLNPAARSLLHAVGTDGEVVGGRLAEALPAALLDTESAHPVDSEGRTRWYRSREVMLGEDGRVVLLTEVTERVQNTERLKAQNRRLEELAGVAAHNLRNPLTAVSGYTRLARETGDLSYLDEVAPATERMETLVEDLLTLSRQGRFVENEETVSLEAAATRAWRTVTGMQTDATLSVEATGRLVADEERLRRLLENLFRNSLEHGRRSDDDGEVTGTKSVHVRVGTLPNGFYVADDGPGIAVEERARALEYSYSTRESSGLGLPTVRNIATAHQWDIELRESASGGLRVEFTGIEWAAE